LETNNQKQLTIKGNQGETVASVDASGSAQFKKLVADKLEIGADMTATGIGRYHRRQR